MCINLHWAVCLDTGRRSSCVCHLLYDTWLMTCILVINHVCCMSCVVGPWFGNVLYCIVLHCIVLYCILFYTFANLKCCTTKIKLLFDYLKINTLTKSVRVLNTRLDSFENITIYIIWKLKGRPSNWDQKSIPSYQVHAHI